MPGIQRLRTIAASITLVVVIVTVACQGQLDPAFLDDRARLSATATVASAETQVAVAEATATMVARELNAQATRTSQEAPSSTSVPTVRPTSTARPPRQPVTPLPTPTPTPLPTDGETPVDPVNPGNPTDPTDPVLQGSPTPSPVPTVAPTSTPTATPGSGSGGFVFTFDPIATLRPEPKLYGPYSGALHHLLNGDEPEQFPIGVETQDFLTSVVFGNPFSAETRNWSVGLWFRVQRSPSIFWNRGSAFPGVSTEGLLLVVESTGSWHLFGRDEISATQGTNIFDTPVQSGSVNGIRTAAGEENTISVAASGDSGSLLFNGELVADLDLSMAVDAGDVIVLAGVFENDEFAGSATPFHSMVIADATGIQEFVGDSGLGRLLAGQPELAFSGVTGDFMVDIDVPVVTPTFSGGWSWQAELNGQANSIMLSIDSSKRLEIVEERLLESGVVEKTVVASTVLTEITTQVGVTNSIRILVVGGQVGFIVNGVPIQGTSVVSDDFYDVIMRAFVRGETSTDGPVVSVDAIRLWQPVQELATGAPGDPDAAGNPAGG